jgi:crotonobetainyl-CoA:carnitine CoA-transferase CaiB-like acyl-CoA transferase
MLQCLRDKAGRFPVPEVAIGDLSSGMFALIGILTALIMRGNTGHGQYIDVSMFDGLLSWMSVPLGMFLGTGSIYTDKDPGYGVFEAGDGKAFALGIAYEDWFWDKLCAAIGMKDGVGIRNEERIRRKEELDEKLQNTFSKRTRDEWLNILGAVDVPVSAVRDAADVLADPHAKFRKSFGDIPLRSGELLKQVNFPIKLSSMSWREMTPPPELGEHTEIILRSLGYSKEEVKQLRTDGVV